MKARYIRVSSATQNNIRQLAKQHPDEKLFIDIVSGSVSFNHREQGLALITAIEAQEIDYVTVHSVDRLGRNAEHILTVLNYLNAKGVNLKIENLGLESMVDGKPNQVFKLIVSVLGNVAEMERESIRERQREGIAIAKANKLYKGRVKGTVETPQQKLDKHKDVVKYLKSGKLSLREITKQCEVSLSTVQRVKKILDDKE